MSDVGLRERKKARTRRAWVAALLLLWRVAQDYFNLPRAIGHRFEIHPLTVIFAVLVGAEAGGIVGIYLAVPLVASLALIWKMRSRQSETPALKDVSPDLPPTLVR
jgi:predicted PurR-regulated permease PerM